MRRINNADEIDITVTRYMNRWGVDVELDGVIIDIDQKVDVTLQLANGETVVADLDVVDELTARIEEATESIGDDPSEREWARRAEEMGFLR